MFEMSVLQGISRISYSIWESAKNVSLFGRGPHSYSDSFIENDISVESEISGLSDISEISLNITIQNVNSDSSPKRLGVIDVVNQDGNMDSDEAEGSNRDGSEVLYTGISNPDISPISHEALGNRSVRSLKTHQRLRTNSECSPLIRSGRRPYEVPPSILLRRKLRANLKTRVTHLNDTPSASRKRALSESFCHDAISQLSEIECIRPQESGLYDSSNGLGSYFYLEHDFLDKKDTGRIDKGKMMSEIFKAISIHSENEAYSQCVDSSVTLAWEQDDIDEVAKAHSPNQPVGHIDQRKCLLYLLGRIINLSERLLSFKPKFNGLKIIPLYNSSDKIPIQCAEGAEGQPIIILHLGKTSRSVNMISKRFDPFRLNVYDILLENSSLLIIYPETHDHMKIALADEGSLSANSGEWNVLLMPCYLPPEVENTEQSEAECCNPDENIVNSFTTVTSPEGEESNEETSNTEQVPDNRSSYNSNTESMEVSISTIVDQEAEQLNQHGSTEDPSESHDVQNITAKVCADVRSKIGEDLNSEDENQETWLPENNKPSATKTETTNAETPDNNRAFNDSAHSSMVRSNTNKPEETSENDTTQGPSALPQECEGITGSQLIPFLQDHAYVSIINSRNGEIIKTWLKSCHLMVRHKVVENRAHLIQHIASVAANNHPDMNHMAEDHYSLSPNVIKDIIGCLKESAIEKELRARCASIVGSNEQRKNRLIGLMIELYGTPKIPVNNPGQVKKKQKKGPKKGKTKIAKSEKIRHEKPEDVIKAPPKTDESKAISETVESIVELPLKTIEESVLNLDSRITKQESLFNTLLVKIDALLADPLKNNKELAERFMILEGNDKALFKNAKNLNEAQVSLSDDMSEKLNALTQKVENLHDIVIALTNTPVDKAGTLSETDDLCKKRLQINPHTGEQVHHEQPKKPTSSIGVQYKASRRKKATQTKNISLTQLSGVDVKDASTQTSQTTDVPNNCLMSRTSDRPNNKCVVSTLKKPSETESTAPEVDDSEKRIKVNKTMNELCQATTNRLQELLLKTEGRKKQIDDSIEKISGQSNQGERLLPNSGDSINITQVQQRQHDPYQETVDRLRQLVCRDRNQNLSRGAQYDNHDNTSKINDDANRTHTPESEKPEKYTGQQSSPNNTLRQRSKALLLYDSYHDEFDQNKFSKSYIIRKVRVDTIEEAIRNKRVINAIQTFKPDLIVMHLGVKDIKKWGPYPRFINNFKILLSEMLENTDCKVCFSQIIPIPGSPNLNRRIKYANQNMNQHITETRKESRFQDRLYTTGNDSLGGYIERYVSEQGEALRLSQRGEAKLWLRLRDSLNRMVSLSKAQSNSRSRPQNE